jgi:DNA-binding LacI/PurR family transcriptional regulator
MLNGIQKTRIAARVGRSVKTVHRVYCGGGNAYSRAAVKEAAEALGYPLPPEPSTPSSESSPSGSPTPSKAA